MIERIIRELQTEIDNVNTIKHNPVEKFYMIQGLMKAIDIVENFRKEKDE